jgi:hypothetical protein
MIVCGVMLYEARRPWLSALVLGVSGLGKETNLLSGTLLADYKEFRNGKGWQIIGRSLLVILPLALWIYGLTHIFSAGGEPIGSRAFSPPFMGYWHKLQDVWAMAQSGSERTYVWGSFVLMASFTVQFFYIILCPKVENPWWRVGFGYAILMIFLGDAVWEGVYGAAPRVLLPMIVAFNVLVTSRMRNLPLLLIGNSSVLVLGGLLVLPSIHSGYHAKYVGAPDTVALNRKQVERMAEFSCEWYPAERRLFDFWRWSAHTAQIKILADADFSSEVRVECELNSLANSFLEIEFDGRTLWSGEIDKNRLAVQIPFFSVPKGGGVLTFKHAWRNRVAQDSSNPFRGDSPRAFRVYNLDFIVR